MGILQVASISTTNLIIQGIITATGGFVGNTINISNSTIGNATVTTLNVNILTANSFTSNSAIINNITAGSVTGNVIGNVTGNLTSNVINTNTLTAQVISGLNLNVLNSISMNNRVIISNTGLTDLPSSGNTGNVLMSNGTVWISRSLPASGFNTMQVFTSSGTFTIPAGITTVKVTVVGAGGSGGARTTNTLAGGGGGGGAGISYLSNLTPGNTILVTVGAGGAPATSDGSNGSAGGFSRIESGTQSITTITANGGERGVGPNTGTYQQNGGSCSGATFNIQGNPGTPPGELSKSGGVGGGSIFGGDGSFNANYSGQSGQHGGGGGPNSQTYSSFGASSGAGGNGIVIFEY